MIRVVLVDDHALVRSGLRRLLEGEDDIRVEDEGGSADDGVRLARLHKPDVVLLDVGMPGRSGIRAVAEIIAAAPAAKVLVLSGDGYAATVREAFAGGASGYLLKDAAERDLVAAVREVAGGRRYVDAALGARLAVAGREDDDPLSDREREVLRLLALGHTNQEIARMLVISVRTAETHRANIMQKLLLTTRAELVRHALRRGLLEEGDDGA